MRNVMQQGYAAGAAQRRALGETSASIAMLDPQTSQIVFAYSAGKMGTNQLQKTAQWFHHFNLMFLATGTVVS
ncbi:hypothetical protein [Tunturiibacter gelidiferens]|uniref:hypothetical protein n=1 Tax=Tunturiibacter gelidiferens TaxID=3069689 RepID=UPI003D9B6AED